MEKNEGRNTEVNVDMERDYETNKWHNQCFTFIEERKFLFFKWDRDKRVIDGSLI